MTREPIVRFEQMIEAQIDRADWEEGIPSEMDNESLRELAADLRQMEVPDADKSRLARPAQLLLAIINARAEAMGLTLGKRFGKRGDLIWCMYQMLVEREVVTRATTIAVQADERKFFQLMDFQLQAIAIELRSASGAA